MLWACSGITTPVGWARDSMTETGLVGWACDGIAGMGLVGWTRDGVTETGLVGWARNGVTGMGLVGRTRDGVTETGLVGWAHDGVAGMGLVGWTRNGMTETGLVGWARDGVRMGLVGWACGGMTETGLVAHAHGSTSGLSVRNIVHVLQQQCAGATVGITRPDGWILGRSSSCAVYSGGSPHAQASMPIELEETEDDIISNDVAKGRGACSCADKVPYTFLVWVGSPGECILSVDVLSNSACPGCILVRG